MNSRQDDLNLSPFDGATLKCNIKLLSFLRLDKRATWIEKNAKEPEAPLLHSSHVKNKIIMMVLSSSTARPFQGV